MALNLNPNNIDLSQRGTIYQLINEVETSQNVERKRQAFIAFECQEGRQKDHVIDRLKYLYPQTYNNFRVGNVKIVKKVIRKKAKAYKTTPIRTLATETETEALNNIYEEFKFGRAFKEADKIYNLHKYVCLWLSYTNPDEDSEELSGEYTLQALAPYEYDLVRDDKGRPTCFILSYSGTEVTKGMNGIEETITEDQRDSSAETKKYKLWTKDHYVEVITRGKVDGRPYIYDMKVINNPINKLPIAFLSQDTAIDYPIPTDLADKAIDWNVELSDLKTASATQGHGQLIISHPETVQLRQLHMGMHTAINLPQSRKETDKPTTAEYISASPDLMGQLSVLKFSLTQILDDEGIVAKSAIEGGIDDVKSGFDRILKEADVQDVVEDNQDLYADCLEQDTYKVLKAYEDALNSNVFNSDTLNVTFVKPKVMISDSETLDNIKKREDLGLLLAHEKHIIINPNLDDAEAREREEAIQAEKEEKAKKLNELFNNQEQPEEDEEEGE